MPYPTMIAPPFELSCRLFVRISCLAVASLFVQGCADRASSPQEEELPSLALELDRAWSTTPFTAIIDAIVQDDGGLIVADVREGGLFRVTAEGERGPALGRQGQGPGEYRGIDDLFEVRADTFALLDVRQRRLIFMSGDGSFTGQSRIPDELRAGPWGFGNDRLMARAPLIRAGGEDAMLPIVAWNWRTSEMDTVAAVKHQPRQLISSGSPEVPFEAWYPEPFAPADLWATTSAGWLVVIRASPYRVERIRASEHSVGPTLTVPTVLISEQDRSEFASVPTSDQWEWPESKPPFLAEANVVFSDLDEVWIATSQEVATGQWYDRLDPAGRRIGRLFLPDGQRLLAVKGPYVYSVETDSLDLQWIRRGSIVPLEAQSR